MLDQSHVLSSFPEIKLSYATVGHNKVCNSDFFVAIPDGVKCFAWLTEYEDKCVCFVMELLNGKIQTVKTVSCCFDRSLAFGTILYGTVFNASGSPFFSIEDVFYYLGNNISAYNWGKKLDVMKSLMTEGFKQKAYNKSFYVFGVPLMSSDIHSLVDSARKLRYRISQIQFKSYNRTGVYSFVWFDKIGSVINTRITENRPLDSRPLDNRPLDNRPLYSRPVNIRTMDSRTMDSRTNNKAKPIKREFVFCVKPDIQNDIYDLHCLSADGIILYDTACIPDFKTSVMMNSLFRNIKENTNLDLLEESDDEEEFENDKADRFVFLDKTYNMVCAYNNKFRKWYPVRLSDTKIVHQSDLLVLEKK
jgi:hypothetical protein